MAALLFVCGLAVYANTFGNGMFWDDNDFILNNQYVQHWQYVPNMFRENVIAGSGLNSNYWRPVLLLVFSTEWHAWQGWTPGYHLVNTAFHLANDVLLFFLLLAVFRKRALAFLAALIFLVHPLQTEAVSYANSLGDSLSVFFMFSGLLLYARAIALGRPAWRQWQPYAAAMLYALALMSKETAVVMPGLLVLIDIFGHHQSRPESWKEFLRSLLGSVRRTWPYFLLAAVYIGLRATVLNLGNTFNLYNETTVFTASVWVRILTFFRILLEYFGLMFWPRVLHMERSVAIATSLRSIDVWLGGLLAAGLLALAIWRLPRRSAVSFGILWFFCAVSVTSNIAAPINGLLYEHWMYVPLVGIFLALSSLGMQLWGLKSAALKPVRVLLLFFAVVIPIGFAVRAIARNVEWRDPVTFYTQTLRYAPTSYRIINNLGMEYAGRQMYQPAQQQYERAVQLDMTNPVAHHNLGNLYVAEGRYREAVTEYETALNNDPKFLFSYRNLIGLYLQLGDKQAAERWYLQFLQYIK